MTEMWLLDACCLLRLRRFVRPVIAIDLVLVVSSVKIKVELPCLSWARYGRWLETLVELEVIVVSSNFGVEYGHSEK